MANRLKISRTEVGAYRLPSGAAEPDAETYQRLQELIRRYLSPAAAALLAEPQKSDDGLYLDWFTPLAGHPVPLNALPSGEQRKARKLLADRIRAIRNLAGRLPDLEPGTSFAKTLLQSTTYPAEDAVYSVDGQPVLTFWGYGELPPDEPLATASESERSGRWPWAILLGSLLLAGSTWGAFQFSLFHWPSAGPDDASLLAAERAQGEQLRTALLARQTELTRVLNQCALQTQLDVLRQAETMFSTSLASLKEDLARTIDVCQARRGLDELMKERLSLMAQLRVLQRELSTQTAQCGDRSMAAAQAEARRLRSKLAGLRKKLADRSVHCGRTQQPAKQAEVPPPPPQEPPKPDKKAAELPPCPGERPPEEAPDVAVVLDASGSMRVPAVLDGNSGRIVREFEQCMLNNGMLAPVVCAGLIAAYESVMGSGQGPTRLEAAQQAVSSVISALPPDVDVGLAVLEDCPRATDYGFYDGSRRGQLLQTVNGLVPRKGTPLADGLVQGAKKVDGIRAPAVMVVVSDGKDSCNQNPCAVAAALKAAKPKLKINVVDIVGDGAVNCIANMTGGDVLTPRSGLSLDQMVKKAARDAQKPEHCK